MRPTGLMNGLAFRALARLTASLSASGAPWLRHCRLSKDEAVGVYFLPTPKISARVVSALPGGGSEGYARSASEAGRDLGRDTHSNNGRPLMKRRFLLVAGSLVAVRPLALAQGVSSTRLRERAVQTREAQRRSEVLWTASRRDASRRAGARALIGSTHVGGSCRGCREGGQAARRNRTKEEM